MKQQLATPLLPVAGSTSPTVHAASINRQSASSHHEATPALSTLGAYFNCLNLFVGLGLLSKPFAFRQCGWTAIPGLAVAVCICAYTGVVIVRCFAAARAVLHDADAGASPATGRSLYDPPTHAVGASGSDRDRDSSGDAAVSYADVGRAALGRWGEWATVVLVVVEFAGGGAVCLAMLWSNVLDLVDAPLWLVTLCSAVVLLPTVLILHFANLSCIGTVGFVASALTTVVVVTIAGYQNSHVNVSQNTQAFTDPAAYGLGMGIFVTSLAGQACLPSIYAQMANKAQYPGMITATFVTIFVVYLLMGLAGYVRYGDDSAVLVTTNIRTSPAGVVSAVESAAVAISCACTVAPLVTVLGDMAEHVGHVAKPNTRRCIRAVVLVVLLLIAYGCYTHLGALESLVGGIGSVCTSIILPCLFYTVLHWHTLTTAAKAGNLALVAVGVLLSVFVIDSNARQLGA